MSNTTPLRDEQNLRVRLAPDDAERLERIAKANERSVAAELRVAVKHYLHHYDEEAA